MKVRLNKRTIDEAAYEGPGGCYLWDTEIAGFGLRIYPTGRKSFLITYRSKGRQRFYTLGRFGEMTVHQARAEALLTLGRARQGEDPSGDRRAAHRAPKMTDLADRHISDHAKIKNKLGAFSVTGGRGIAAFCRSLASVGSRTSRGVTSLD